MAVYFQLLSGNKRWCQLNKVWASNIIYLICGFCIINILNEVLILIDYIDGLQCIIIFYILENYYFIHYQVCHSFHIFFLNFFLAFLNNILFISMIITINLNNIKNSWSKDLTSGSDVFSTFILHIVFLIFLRNTRRDL